MIVAKKLTVCLYAGAAPEKLSCMYSSQSLVTTACDGVTVITSTRGDTLSNPSYMASYNTHIGLSPGKYHATIWESHMVYL